MDRKRSGSRKDKNLEMGECKQDSQNRCMLTRILKWMNVNQTLKTAVYKLVLKPMNLNQNFKTDEFKPEFQNRSM